MHSSNHNNHNYNYNYNFNGNNGSSICKLVALMGHECLQMERERIHLDCRDL